MLNPALNVNFVSPVNPNLASYRLRVEKPAALMNSSGKISCTIEDTCLSSADINFFSKHFNPDRDASAIALSETIRGFDICDDHFDRPHGIHYLFMLDRADIVTCNTATMQERIYEVSGRLARIVPDPISFPEGQFEYSSDPQYLWFGNAVNIMSVLPHVWAFPNLTIITNVELPNPPAHVKTYLWRPGLVEKLMPKFDVVVLPRNNDPWALTKSPNRAVDAMYAGKFVITDFPEVYRDLGAFCFTGPLKEGILFYKNNEAAVTLMAKNAQEFVKRNYGDAVVLQAWLKALKAH